MSGKIARAVIVAPYINEAVALTIFKNKNPKKPKPYAHSNSHKRSFRVLLPT